LKGKGRLHEEEKKPVQETSKKKKKNKKREEKREIETTGVCRKRGKEKAISGHWVHWGDTKKCPNKEKHM